MGIKANTCRNFCYAVGLQAFIDNNDGKTTLKRLLFPCKIAGAIIGCAIAFYKPNTLYPTLSLIVSVYRTHMSAPTVPPEVNTTSSQKGQGFELDQYIGITVKKARAQAGLKIADVAQLSGISQGMISKIENAQVSTSLETLNRLCKAIGISLSSLFNDFDRPESQARFTRAGEGLEVVGRGTQKGHKYQLLAYQRGGKRSFEPFLVTMDDLSEVFPTFSHPGEELIYLVKGSLKYRHGNQVYEMNEGDSLLFDAEIPHGPETLLEVPISLLSIIHYNNDE